eukprot:jgi/Psemu1/283357/fgenesh1_pg.25_\
MSFPFEYDKNDRDQPPPHKRQRVLSEGTEDPLGPSASPSSSNETSRNTPGDPVMPPPLSIDTGPIFTDVDDLIHGCSSVESVLGVPAQILFRQVGGDRNGIMNTKDEKGVVLGRRRRRPLLTRQEVEQFLRLTLLAQEIDVLLDLSETVLSRRRFARRFRRDVLMQRQSETRGSSSSDATWKNPWLITLGPILDVLEQRQPQQNSLRRPLEQQQQVPLYQTLSDPQHNKPRQDILQHVHEQMTRLCHELQACGVYELERSAEQNRSLVASLTDIVGYENGEGEAQQEGLSDTGQTSAVRILAREKHALSKLQDHLSKRVRSMLTSLCFSPVSTTRVSNGTNGDGGIVERNGKDNDNDNTNSSKQILFDDRVSSSSIQCPRNRNELTSSLRPHENTERTTIRIGHPTEASQRTVGAAAAMMTLATEKSISTNHEPSKNKMHSDLFRSEGNRKQQVSNGIAIAIGSNANMPRHSDNQEDDCSFVEDPPSDGEDRKDECRSQRHNVTSKENATATNMGIFDVVDALTPCSESEQPGEETQQRCNKERHDHRDNANEHISSLSSQSQTAAEALTRMGQGNR